MSSAKTSLALLAFALAASTTSCASAPKDEAALAMQAANRPASPEERAAANRADPLTRANFWAKENLKDGEDLTVSLEFARALREIGSHERALDVLSRALIVHPESADALMLLGRIQMALGDVPTAGRVFHRATEVAPERAETWAALGTTFDREGQHKLAQTAYQRALELEPLRTTTLTNYGLSLVLTGDLPGAEAKLRQAAANADAGARVTENLALVLGLQGKFEDMKSVSGAAAPEEVVDQNVALLQGLIQPARSWDALAEKPAPVRVAEAATTADAPIAAPVTRVEDTAGTEAPKRVLRPRN
ncbi:tetratricopeptide repeat protein [Hyphomonas sp.]|uniref:tetratricopeptide repeat protein n=1 Tax=Hyphomonas sp. TaxID=87 RepID=UPI000AD37845|nr:tetratricopeptide repeat protein [Hyphomonas sp.]